MLLPSDWFYVYPVPNSVSFGFRVFLSFELVSWSCWAWLTESVSACVLQINIDKPLCRFHSKCRNQWLFLFKFYFETNLSVYGLQALNNSTVLSLRAWLGNNSAIQKTVFFLLPKLRLWFLSKRLMSSMLLHISMHSTAFHHPPWGLLSTLHVFAVARRAVRAGRWVAQLFNIFVLAYPPPPLSRTLSLLLFTKPSLRVQNKILTLNKALGLGLFQKEKPR